MSPFVPTTPQLAPQIDPHAPVRSSIQIAKMIDLSAPWPVFRGPIPSNGQSRGSGPQKPEAKWVSKTLLPVEGGAAVSSSGTVYFGGNDGKLHAVRADGSTAWVFQTAGFVGSTPAVASDGTVYFGSYDFRIYALSSSGAKRWSVATRGFVDSSPSIGADGTIYVGSRDHSLYALNPSGTVRWTFATGDEVRSSPAVSPVGRIYVGSSDRHLYAINPDGSLGWKFTTGGPILSSPVRDRAGTLYFGSNDHRLYAVNADGSLRWSFLTLGAVRSSPAVGSDGTVYVGSDDGNLYSVDGNGSLRWTRHLALLGLGASPIIDAGTVFVGSDKDRVFALARSDGHTVWSFAVQGDVDGSAAIGNDGTLYVGSGDVTGALTAVGRAAQETSICAAVVDPSCTCICQNCGDKFDACTTDPGCSKIRDCVQATGCTGAGCYARATCQATIDGSGGLVETPAGLAGRLAECVQASCPASCLTSHLAPSCADNVKNGDEQGIDCGGSRCPHC